MQKKRLISLLVLSALAAAVAATALLKARRATSYAPTTPPVIDLWYGDEQYFGRLGTPQRWINVLGRVYSVHGTKSVEYRLNDGPAHSLSLGPDPYRLPRPGDFNIELAVDDLRDGFNRVLIHAQDRRGNESERIVTLHYSGGHIWPLPYRIKWSEVGRIGDAAQVVDGLWRLLPDGVRTIESGYDRVIAIGDQTWRDYEVRVSVTFHAFAPPVEGPPGFGVTHAAVAVRWPGHDEDSHQPHVKWFPLGSTAEFRLSPTLEGSAWRILGGPEQEVEAKRGRRIELGEPYRIAVRVETLPGGDTRYRAKLWAAVEPEPTAWQVTAVEGMEDVQSGSTLLIAHHTDVTFGDVTVTPLPADPQP